MLPAPWESRVWFDVLIDETLLWYSTPLFSISSVVLLLQISDLGSLTIWTGAFRPFDGASTAIIGVGLLQHPRQPLLCCKTCLTTQTISTSLQIPRLAFQVWTLVVDQKNLTGICNVDIIASYVFVKSCNLLWVIYWFIIESNSAVFFINTIKKKTYLQLKLPQTIPISPYTIQHKAAFINLGTLILWDVQIQVLSRITVYQAWRTLGK